MLLKWSQPGSGLKSRFTREAPAARSHINPQRTQTFSLFWVPLRPLRLGVESDLQVMTAGRHDRVRIQTISATRPGARKSKIENRKSELGSPDPPEGELPTSPGMQKGVGSLSILLPASEAVDRRRGQDTTRLQGAGGDDREGSGRHPEGLCVRLRLDGVCDSHCQIHTYPKHISCQSPLPALSAARQRLIRLQGEDHSRSRSPR